MANKKTSKRNRAGRPTKYSPQMLANARRYIKQCEDEHYDYVKSDGPKGTSWELRVRVKLPTIEGLAQHLGVRRSTIYEWQKHHAAFSDTLEELLDKQREMLIKGGLGNYYNPTIAKLVLAANHGMTDRSDITSGGKPIEGNTINFANMSDEADSQ